MYQNSLRKEERGVSPTLWYVPHKPTTFLTSPLSSPSEEELLAALSINIYIFLYGSIVIYDLFPPYRPFTFYFTHWEKKTVLFFGGRIGGWAELGKPVVSYKEALHQIIMRF